MIKFIVCLIIILGKPGSHIVHAETKLIRQKLTDTNFYISIPPDFNVSRVEGADFVVYYFTPEDTTHIDTFSFGLYIGNFPSGFKQPDEYCNKEILEGNLLTKVCKWDIYSCNDDYFIETVVENTDKELLILRSDEKIRAFGSSSKREDLDFIMKIFSTLNKN